MIYYTQLLKDSLNYVKALLKSPSPTKVTSFGITRKFSLIFYRNVVNRSEQTTRKENNLTFGTKKHSKKQLKNATNCLKYYLNVDIVVNGS